IQMIKNITACENEILITSKPNLKTIEAICDYFNTIPEMNFRTMGMENAQMIDLRRVNAKAYIQFRFTITTIGDSMRRIWEENAPTFEERLSCLKYAYGKGYKTSISIEPYLENPSLIIKEVEPYTTESIWVGIMNKSKLTPMAKEVYQNQNLGNLLYSKEFIKEHLDSWITLAKGKLRLKDSIQNMLGVDFNEVGSMKKENQNWNNEFKDLLTDIKGSEEEKEVKEQKELSQAERDWQKLKKELLKGKRITL
ncbi:MAG: hypothetical protein NT116_05780, partial [Candidatus Parcubacteria bacterium]|nr:hypothetical protein [Candidatus Parcubacteria bacterium]